MVNLGPKKSPLSSVILIFRIPYYTQWGQSLLISGSEPALGGGNVKLGLGLVPFHQGEELIWHGRISVPIGFRCEYSYYLVDDNRNILRWEAGKKRNFSLPEGIKEGEVVEIHDLWKTASEALFLRSAFKTVIFGGGLNFEPEPPLRTNQTKDNHEDSIVVVFKISCPTIEEGTSVYVTGSVPQLGQWRVEDGLRLNYIGDSIWESHSVVRKVDFPIKYKYYHSCKQQDASLEIGPYRELALDTTSNSIPKYVLLSDGSFRRIPWRGAGVAIPMFSIRSIDDLGVGEFLDLKLLVDWAVETGFHLVQLLPINDTSVHGMWWDSYPYSSLSVFALHPLYLRVQALSEKIPQDLKQEILMQKEGLNGKDVDYEATMTAKLAIAKKIFNLEKDEILGSKPFLKFLSDNEEWLKPYAAFCFLRDFFGTSDHSQWGRFSQFSKEKLEKLISKDNLHYDVICFQYYIQYHLHLQLSEAAAYARRKKVVLKGDLPIGVDRNSVDTWVYPNLFRMNTSTGAPPDYFDKNGQNWGFPTYNWEEMSKDNYAWWRARLSQMAKYFSAYRIDHILGFFRIWELPNHAATGLVGKFRPSIALSQEELEREGIWDFDRLSCPYIRQNILQDKFGAKWMVIASCFLNEYAKECFEFKEDCNTEKKIIEKLVLIPEKSLWAGKEIEVQRSLLDLLQNIVLIQDPEEQGKFYPRFNLEDTSSFQDLDDHSKNVLKRFYYDYYFHRQENLWRQNALKTLPVLLSSSDMLACGEDLGLIPSCVHPVMEELGLIGLRIQRMPSEPELEFGIPSQYSYMTVCAPSCHDCSTMRAWWEEDEDRRFRFYKDVIGSNDEPPAQCTPEVANFIIHQHLFAPSMWAIFPLQDLLALKEDYTDRPANEETINDPTNPRHYWRYRLHVTLESLLKDEDLKMKIRSLVIGSGRAYPTSEVEIKKKKGVENIESKICNIQLNVD
ncbi:4-alpha-glucanotransferase DPE2 isoform X2 [Phalaenopsis equestris]|uniref:4-alpha-glucanotransferase DPE2 isoform X2 n=1 Tax=Phalaenopsis equestris TaxID=78828 RepID=UPI0009E1A2AF|nr:4-alpha-glucanotransferase DPE2 isoform X2 [Phalaenopsis equestris]